LFGTFINSERGEIFANEDKEGREGVDEGVLEEEESLFRAHNRPPPPFALEPGLPLDVFHPLCSVLSKGMGLFQKTWGAGGNRKWVKFKKKEATLCIGLSLGRVSERQQSFPLGSLSPHTWNGETIEPNVSSPRGNIQFKKAPSYYQNQPSLPTKSESSQFLITQ
jgi:hypothetical protein